jgi:hypothetical protein
LSSLFEWDDSGLLLSRSSLLDVTYGLDVPRWHDPVKLSEAFRYEDREYTVDGKYCAQPTLALASQGTPRPITPGWLMSSLSA